MAAHKLPRATVIDTLRFFAQVFIPTFAKGLLLRRPAVVAMAERFQLDKAAVRCLQSMRSRYGRGPVILPIPLQPQAVILSSDDANHVLDNSPEPFALATTLKRSALSHFEPENVLISHGPKREARRDFHEEVLDFHRPAHRYADEFIETVNAEADQLLQAAQEQGELTWEQFTRAWYRVVRRVVFGEHARRDENVTEMLAKLRSDANWAFAKPKRTRLRESFLAGVQTHLDRAEPGSLANLIAQMPLTPEIQPAQQVPQWLFAFDAAGITIFRAIAVLASHPEHRRKAMHEIERDDTVRQHLPYLRACILETLRLWPTTPMILRESTRETLWENGVLPAKTSILIFAPFFHRDDQTLPYAHQFTPELWLGDEHVHGWAMVPFSGGPGTCPGRQIVLLLASAMLAALLDHHDIELRSHRSLSPSKPLPGTLNNFGLRFAVRARASATQPQKLYS